MLEVRLWRHDGHTFHLKGLMVDEDFSLLTGHNINPRAWRMDLENGLLVRDPHRLLAGQNRAELERVLAHARRLDHYTALETVESYPAPVRRLQKRLARARVDRLVNQVL
jgi:CDP-diacylglycerol--serine O-phosphatidyltransferase